MWHAKSINGQDHTLELTDHRQVKDMWLLQLATAWWQPHLARHPHAKGTGLLTTESVLFYQVLLQVNTTSLPVVYLEHVLSKVKQQFTRHIPSTGFAKREYH